MEMQLSACNPVECIQSLKLRCRRASWTCAVLYNDIAQTEHVHSRRNMCVERVKFHAEEKHNVKTPLSQDTVTVPFDPPNTVLFMFGRGIPIGTCSVCNLLVCSVALFVYSPQAHTLKSWLLRNRCRLTRTCAGFHAMVLYCLAAFSL